MKQSGFEHLDNLDNLEPAQLRELNKALRLKQRELILQLTVVKKSNVLVGLRAKELGGEVWPEWKADKEEMRQWLNEITRQGGRFEAFSP